MEHILYALKGFFFLKNNFNGVFYCTCFSDMFLVMLV